MLYDFLRMTISCNFFLKDLTSNFSYRRREYCEKQWKGCTCWKFQSRSNYQNIFSRRRKKSTRFWWFLESNFGHVNNQKLKPKMLCPILPRSFRISALWRFKFTVNYAFLLFHGILNLLSVCSVSSSIQKLRCILCFSFIMLVNSNWIKLHLLLVNVLM